MIGPDRGNQRGENSISSHSNAASCWPRTSWSSPTRQRRRSSRTTTPSSNFLTAAGHTIDADSGTFTARRALAAQLADVDLILVSRTTTSGNYDDGTEPQDWNGLNKPMLVMAPHLARTTSLGLAQFDGDRQRRGRADKLQRLSERSPSVCQRPDDQLRTGRMQDRQLELDDRPAGATTVATHHCRRATHAAIVDIPAGATAFNGKGTFGERRVFFTMPDYPDDANQDFDDVLTQNAKRDRPATSSTRSPS